MGFLRNNTNEVLTLLFTNPEGLSLTDLWAPVFVASGISDFVYISPHLSMKQSEWPTLGQLIDSGQRVVVVFLDSSAEGGSVNYILPEFEMVCLCLHFFLITGSMVH